MVSSPQTTLDGGTKLTHRRPLDQPWWRQPCPQMTVHVRPPLHVDDVTSRQPMRVLSFM
jgi:hypothetical protein